MLLSEFLLNTHPNNHIATYFPRTNREAAERIAEKINSTCEAQSINDIPVSISIGIGIKESVDESIYDTMRMADDAMYQTKANKKAGKLLSK